MNKIIILGSSNAIADKDHQNAHMVIVGKKRIVLIDSPHNPILRLTDIGVDFNEITDLILTHFHPDHVSGIPLLLMDMWLRGREKPLTLHGLDHALSRLENLMDAFGWATWPGFFPVTFNRIPSVGINPVLSSSDFDIYGSEVDHMIPTLGTRIEFKESGKVATYSCDTEPCEEVVQLAKGVDILIHEASGPFKGHSSSKQAAEVATKAEARELYLIHYPTGEFWQKNLLEDARSHFSGNVELAEDFMVLEF
ncbi:MAG: MBL fold metallo-hydrolase [Anaerolineae bacterium]|jgi:ribonuclease Z|nr:MBL fold metallo-hydrolase [Anaerolineae bacterium]MBT3712728.1 MBL fold metallo-hydrolase [Anaerolineae bacterium]MBT4311577.1 MBL fold metallo-hydrolase [Anaerolineae bacterium]MBT4459108.1 MBL fold metallo-hydrolase [Anaerolineae bacterium]MBT4840929.1 MBL fold metallo-hydrolase [Anaerolineae bacterium]